MTTIRNLRGWDVGDINAFLKQREMRIANGYGPLKNNTFRIAHMGEIQMGDVDTLLEALEAYLQAH